jgi:hypothetical protein
MWSFKVKVAHGITFTALIVLLSSGGAKLAAQALPTTEQFASKIRDCITSQNLSWRLDFVEAIVAIYGAERPDGAQSFKSPVGFMGLLPKEVTLEGYRFYQQCVSPALGMSGPGDIGKEITLTCHAEQDLSGDVRREGIVMPLACPPEVERGYSFRISGSYACGNISEQDIKYDQHNKLPRAVEFSTKQGCIRHDESPEAAKNCVRPDDKSYKASHSCFVVTFRTRK